MGMRNSMRHPCHLPFLCMHRCLFAATCRDLQRTHRSNISRSPLRTSAFLVSPEVPLSLSHPPASHTT